MAGLIISPQKIWAENKNRRGGNHDGNCFSKINIVCQKIQLTFGNNEAFFC
jgi:hypothetical protein